MFKYVQNEENIFIKHYFYSNYKKNDANFFINKIYIFIIIKIHKLS